MVDWFQQTGLYQNMNNYLIARIVKHASFRGLINTNMQQMEKLLLSTRENISKKKNSKGLENTCG